MEDRTACRSEVPEQDVKERKEDAREREQGAKEREQDARERKQDAREREQGARKREQDVKEREQDAREREGRAVEMVRILYAWKELELLDDRRAKDHEKLEAVRACAERLYASLSEVGSFWLSAETVPELSMCLLCICGVIFASSICVSGPLKTKNEAAWYLNSSRGATLN